MTLFTNENPIDYTTSDLGYNRLLTKDSGSSDPPPEIQNVFTSGSAAKNITSGGLVSALEQESGILFSGKTSFTDTTDGYRMGIDTDRTFKFVMGTTGNQIDWNVTTASILTLTGAVSIISGSLAGMTITATALTATSGGNTTIVSSGATAFTAGPTGSPTFTVTQAGVLTSTSAVIGGFSIGTDYIKDAADSFGLASTVTGGDDVRFWAGDTFTNRATADFRVTEAGVVTASNITITGGSVVTSVLSGTVGLANLNVANRGWSQTSAFSVTDADTVAWGAGTFTSADGTAYSIGASNTGNMVAKTYIYLDIAVSTTAYQTTTTSTTAVGAGKVLVAIAQNATNEATFTVLDGQGGQNIDATSIVTGSITANEIAASTITAGKLTISQLSAIAADLGTITAGTVTGGTIQTASSGARVVLGTTGIKAYDATTQRAQILNDGSGWFGSSTAMAWDTSGNLTLNGSAVETVQTRAENDYTKGIFLGAYNDGLTTAFSNATITRLPLSTRVKNTTSGFWKIYTVGLGGQSTTSGSNYDWSFDYEFFCRCASQAGSADSGGLIGVNYFWGLLDNTVAIPNSLGDNGLTLTTRHIGIIVARDNKLYASNANGTTQTTEEITGITFTDENNYKIVFDSGTNIKFYVNDVLKSTSTTNLPSGSTNPPDVRFGARFGQNTSDIGNFLLYNNYKLIKT